MLFFKYPLSRFIKGTYSEKYEDDKYSYIIHVKFKNIKSKMCNEYLSVHKAISISNFVSDNGKLESADFAEYILTNVDMQIIRQCYSYDMEIVSFKYALNDYLPNEFRQFILDMYFDKTTLKGIEEKQDLYLKKKQKINSCYGMMLTKTYFDIIDFAKSQEWTTRKFSKEVFEEIKAKKEKQSMYSEFLPFQAGLFVTAYARLQLFKNFIIPCDDLIHYYDTDSIYFQDRKVLEYVKKYNGNIPLCHAQISSQLNCDIEKLSPKDIKGNKHPIGLMEQDGTYKEAVYMGAKRYALRKQDGKLKQTVAGVRKGSVTALNDDLHNFNKSLIYDYDESQKLIMTYQENQTQGIVWNRGKVDEFVSYNQYSNNLMPTTYKMNISDDYLQLVKYFQDYEYNVADVARKEVQAD